MKLKVGTREDGTDYMLSARAIATDITDKFGRSEPWLLLCNQGLDLEGDGTDPTGLRRPFAEVDSVWGDDDTSGLSRFIRSIDRSADALAVVQADDTLSYPYLTAKRLLALCETESSRIHGLANDAGLMGLSWWSASDFESAIQRVLDDETEVPKWAAEKVDAATFDKMADALMDQCEDWLEPDHSDMNERIDAEARLIVSQGLGL